MSAIDEARAVANKLKEEAKAKEEKAQAEVKSSLVILHGNKVTPEVIDFFRVHSEVGSANLAGSLPQLKVTEPLSKNELENGEMAKAGEFYYAPAKEAFKELEVSIVTISRGFYSMSNDKPPVPKFTQLVGGMIVDSMQPFIMFFSSTRLENLWNFGKEIRPLIRNRKAPLPMFSLLVKLSLEKRVNDKKQESHVVKFELVKEKGNVKIISDLEFLNLIRNGVDTAEGMIESFIEQKEVDKRTGILIRDGLNQAVKEVFVEGKEPPVPGEPTPF